MVTRYNVFYATVGGYSVTWRIFSTVRDITINVGDILSTMGVFNTVGGEYFKYPGGYLEYHEGCSVPHIFMISPTVLNILHSTQDIPHRTEHPHSIQHLQGIIHDYDIWRIRTKIVVKSKESSHHSLTVVNLPPD